MSTHFYSIKLNSTKDCVDLLNDNYKIGNWKRISKFNLNLEYNSAVVRVFYDGNEYVTLIQDSHVILHLNCNLNKYKDLISKIEKICKYIYTWDYTSVWFQPNEMKLWITAGDGGYMYSELPKKQVAKLTEDGDFSNFQDDVVEKLKNLFPELKEIIFEAECDPDEDENYIQICCINDLGNIEYDES